MKKTKMFFILSLLILILMGCTKVKERFVLEDIDSIKIQTGIKQKEIVDGEELESIIDFLNNIELINKVEADFKEGESYRVLLTKKVEVTEKKEEDNEDEEDKEDEELVGYISFKGNKIYYKNNWYYLDEDTFTEFKDLYEGLNAPVETTDELKAIREKRKAREYNMDGDSLQGVWVFEDETEIEFQEDILIQGDYSFRYSIEEKDQNQDTLHLSVYGLKGLNIKGKKLFDLYITLDDTKCNAKIKKVVEQLGPRDLIYEYNMVYVDEEEVVLGAFDDVFFIR